MPLVLIGASANIARVAQSISDRIILVQQPDSLNPQVLWVPALVCATVSVLIWAWYTVRTGRA